MSPLVHIWMLDR